MNIDNIRQQIESSKQMISVFKKQNLIFESVIDQAIKGVPTENQHEVQKVKNLYLKAKNLAKQGKMDEVNALIKEFTDGRKNSK